MVLFVPVTLTLSTVFVKTDLVFFRADAQDCVFHSLRARLVQAIGHVFWNTALLEIG